MTCHHQILSSLAPFYIWAYNGAMKIANFPPEFDKMGASGECPHCRAVSYFKPVATKLENPTIASSGSQCAQAGVSACQCEACRGYVLVVARRTMPNPMAKAEFSLMAVYPLGTPNQVVEDGIPASIADDFTEALRCEWIKAYRACVVMCRRAIQSSAIELNAKGPTLIHQIDNLFESGKITTALKDFAHEIRLTGNDGAHPDKDGLSGVKQKDADDIIEFTREYLHHVHVMPAKLKARKSPQADKSSEVPQT